MRNTPTAPISEGAQVHWSGLIPAHEWSHYQRVIDQACQEHIPFALGGGFAFSAYSQRWRNTKDIDLYILPRDRERMIALVTAAGFTDYFEQLPYDRAWIYRGYREGVICDLIWAMANQRSQVDEAWLDRGRQVEIHGRLLRFLPPEELIWAKLYVMQRERCDWPDLLNILNIEAATLDWQHLLERVGPDVSVLGGLLSMFKWLCPPRAAAIPTWVWTRVGVYGPPRTASAQHDACDPHHVRLLDSRDWFGPNSPPPAP